MDNKERTSKDSNPSFDCTIVDLYSQVNRIIAEINGVIRDTAKDLEKNSISKNL